VSQDRRISPNHLKEASAQDLIPALRDPCSNPQRFEKLARWYALPAPCPCNARHGRRWGCGVDARGVEDSGRRHPFLTCVRATPATAPRLPRHWQGRVLRLLPHPDLRICGAIWAIHFQGSTASGYSGSYSADRSSCSVAHSVKAARRLAQECRLPIATSATPSKKTPPSPAGSPACRPVELGG